MRGLFHKRGSQFDQAIGGLRPAVISMAVIGVFLNLTLLVPPLYMLQVYDRVLSSGNVNTLVMLSGIGLAMLAVYGVLEFCRRGLLVRASRDFDARLSAPIFKAFAARIEKDNASVARKALQDVRTIRETLAGGTLAAISDVPWTPFFILLCYVMHPVMGLVALIATLLIFSLALVTNWLTRNGNKLAAECSHLADRTAMVTFNNAETLRGLAMCGVMQQRWQNDYGAALNAQTITGEQTALTLALSKFVRLTVQSAMLGTGAWLAVQNEISAGMMVAASIIMGRALAPVEQVVGSWKRITAARASYSRLKEFFAGLHDHDDRTELPKPSGHLELENAAVLPPGAKKHSVAGVSFSLKPGESVAVIGSSGSGKSSLARAIAGVWPTTHGSIKLDGARLDQWSSDTLGQEIGYVGQQAALFDGTVAQNIARFSNTKSEHVIAAAKLAGVHEAILRLPDGYETVIGESGISLSGGMSQRVALARAVFGNPCLLVLDEPNANLDSEGDAALAASIAALKAQGTTVVVVTHKPQLLNQIDNVLVLRDGQPQVFGPREKVLRPKQVAPTCANSNENGSAGQKRVA